MMACIRTIQY